MKAIFEENTTAIWKGADIINLQRAQPAVQNLQKKYCTKQQPATKFSDPGASTSTMSEHPTKKQLKKPSQTTSIPLTLSKTPQKMEPQNPHCEVLCLPGTTENNLKASRLNLFITTHVCGKVMFSYCLCVCLSFWAITFECLDTETLFLVW